MLTKRDPGNPSRASVFSIESVMAQGDGQANCLESSSTEFAANYENNFLVMDPQNLLGVNGKDPEELVLENLQGRRPYTFGRRKSGQRHFISTLLYDPDSKSLFRGDNRGHLIRYTLDTNQKTLEGAQPLGDLGIGPLISSTRFKHWVFFGGKNNRIKVFHLRTQEFLEGVLETSVREIYSLQVCAKSDSEVYLAVSGYGLDYTNGKTDVFDLTPLLEGDPYFQNEALRKKLEEAEQEIFTLKRENQCQAKTIAKITEKKKKYKGKYNKVRKQLDEIRQKYLEVVYNPQIKSDSENLSCSFEKSEILDEDTLRHQTSGLGWAKKQCVEIKEPGLSPRIPDLVEKAFTVTEPGLKLGHLEPSVQAETGRVDRDNLPSGLGLRLGLENKFVSERYSSYRSLIQAETWSEKFLKT